MDFFKQLQASQPGCLFSRPSASVQLVRVKTAQLATAHKFKVRARKEITSQSETVRKLPRIDDRKSVHISNIDRLTIVNPRGFGAVSDAEVISLRALSPLDCGWQKLALYSSSIALELLTPCKSQASLASPQLNLPKLYKQLPQLLHWLFAFHFSLVLRPPLWIKLLFTVLLFFSPLSGKEEVLHFDDIHRVMDEILKEHLKQKNLNPQLIRTSFKLYIDQFDPKRIYLIENEVNPYLQMSDQKAQEVIQHYMQKDFSEYQRLNSVIQESIRRSRYIRKKIEKNPKQLFLVTLSTDAPTTVLPPFAKNETELNQRIAANLSKQLRYFSKKDGVPSQSRMDAFFKFYEQNLQNEEDRYLYVDNHDLPLTADQKEHLEVLHIMQSLTKSLDSHSAFLDEKQAFDMKVRLEKGFKGIGVVIRERANGFIIHHIYPNSPAGQSGKIKVDDLIVAIDGHDIRSESLKSVLSKLRDLKKPTVTLQILNEANKETPLSVTLKRELVPFDKGRVETKTFPFQDGYIGVLTMDAFYQGAKGVSSDMDIQRAIEKLEQRGNLKGLIIDLRENGGGFLSQAVKVSGLFITTGVVVISKSEDGKEKYYRDILDKVVYDGPLIILTSRATASAAEIVAQSLKDYGKAIIVGDKRTYGKGTIQSQTITENNSDSYFKVTIGKYYTVSGQSPQGEGVEADIIVPSPYSLLTIGEEFLDNTPKNDTISSSFIDPLKDVPAGMKPWYFQYYLPKLQERDIGWRQMIPELKKRSANRVEKISEFQSLLRLKKGQPPPRSLNIDQLLNLELDEAVNIMKDMIRLQTHLTQKERRTNGSFKI